MYREQYLTVVMVISVLLTDQANQQTANASRPAVHRSKKKGKNIKI